MTRKGQVKTLRIERRTVVGAEMEAAGAGGCELLLFMLTKAAFCECNHADGGTPYAYFGGILRDRAGACICLSGAGVAV